MSGNQPTLGQAIDQILNALGPLDEGARRTALAAACMQLGIVLDNVRAPALGAIQAESNPNPLPVDTAIHPPVASVPPQGTLIDIRTFKEQKKPTSARQMACVVAFYLQELAPIAERKETVNVSDLEKYFKQGGFKLPGKMSQIMVDLKGAGYMETAARGEYKLNAVGYNLVAHSLPGNAE